MIPSAPNPPSATRAILGVLVPALALAVGITYLAAAILWPSPRDAFDLKAFGALPVQHEGRVKPFDTVARNALLLLGGKQSATVDGKRLPALRWLLDVMTQRPQAEGYEVFRIDDPDLKALLGAGDDKKNRFSWAQLIARAQTLDEQFQQAARVPSEQRSPYQERLFDLRRKLDIYSGLAELTGIQPVPPAKPGEPWQSLAEAVQRQRQSAQPHEPFIRLGEILSAYHHDQPQRFNDLVSEYRDLLAVQQSQEARLARIESFFRRGAPFLHAMPLYVLAFVLACASWLGLSTPLRRAAGALALVAMLVHLTGLAARIYIHGRPPVTNLYASAVFIGFGGVAAALVLEAIHRQGLAVAVGSLIGCATLIIAHNLSDGDDMEAVRAVLATNFWLTTHVLIITLGYSATFLAGALAVAGIFWGLGETFAHRVNGRCAPQVAVSLGRMVYGVVCFATLLSFVGTVLGGIWADQSWGRFWGWDPKENGALLIVLWNALILHARWAGMVRDRGLMVLAIFGNIVTAWSWFGTNMLGVGLHSYGFMRGAFFWLSAFMASQLLVMALGIVPAVYWWSVTRHAREARVAPAPT